MGLLGVTLGRDTSVYKGVGGARVNDIAVFAGKDGYLFVNNESRK